MKLLRAYYRWNIDIYRGLAAVIRRWPWVGVAIIATEITVLGPLDAPLPLQVAVGACGGLGIFYLITEA